MRYKTELQSNNTDLQSILDMILALGLVDAPKLITFTIVGTSYQAEEGMTWGEWCDSAYNTGGYYISNGFVRFSDGSGVSSTGAGSLKNTFRIIAGHVYYRLDNGGN